MSYEFRTVNHIIAGPHSINHLLACIEPLAKVKSVLIVTQPSIQRMGAIDKIKLLLDSKDISSLVLMNIKPEPTIANIEEVFAQIRREGFDLIIGIGGGSVLDAAKILSVLFTNKQSVADMLGTNMVQMRGIPTLLIPTTSGTGSEVTPNAIVTIPEQELKVGIVSSFLLPNSVILDPVLTLGLPKSITAATGMDAFTHAIESYISTKANPISDMFALQSIRLLSQSLETAYFAGNDLKARERMLLGSMYGGMALTGSGTAAVHALAYPLGGKFGIAHGVANSMLLPHVMAFNMGAITDRLSDVALAMGMDPNFSAIKQAELVIEKIAEWTKVLEIPQDLHIYGVQDADIKGLAIAASKVTRLLNNNPKTLDLIQMEEIYRKLLTGKGELI